MSDFAATPTPSEPKKQQPANRMVWMIAGPICLIAGVFGIYRGINEMFGSGLDPQVKKLLVQCDQEFTDASKLTATVAPDLQSLLNDVDKLGLDAVHKQKQVAVKALSDKYGQASAGFRQADAKIAAALKLETNDKMKDFLQAKSKAIELYAQVCDQYQKIVDLLMDTTIVKNEDLLPKLKQLADQRDALQKQAQDADAAAEKIAGAAKS